MIELHNDILHKDISQHGGVVFQIVGDEFQAAFPTALQALQTAISIQQDLSKVDWNEIGPLKVRMGLHTGEASLDPGGDEYAPSYTKNRVARVRSVAYGGQILLSQETADLVQRELPAGVLLKDLGEQRLKGMILQEHLYQVCVPGLMLEFPALETATTRPNNLPIQMTSFIGRETEISAVKHLLVKHRLVTLTGAGGTGKTRLSLQVAAEVLDLYPNGTWLVELAALADPNLLPKVVSSVLNVPESPGREIRDMLVNFLRQKCLLLILDNCEHLLQACASLVDVLLHSCPGLTILVSSREILGVEGEIPFRVPSLSLPEPHHQLLLTELSQYDAIRLFVERGQVVIPGFAITVENAPFIVQVVCRLDGIPLAIELAAARLRLLSVEQIALRLKDAFRLLTGGSRNVLPRHQTLRALIDWSYNLLSQAECTVLRRLSVFAGSWTLEAAESICSDPIEKFSSSAEQVCSDEGEGLRTILSENILDQLGGLVDKSLIQTVTSADGLNRFYMLETIRQYAHEKLVSIKEAEKVRTRHMQYFCRLVEELAPKIYGREQIETLDRLEFELGNLRLALEWGLQTDIETELTIATSLKPLWHIRAYWTEGINWLEYGLEAEQAGRDTAPPEPLQAIIRAEALNVLGFHLYIKANTTSDQLLNERAKVCLNESLTLFRASGNENSSGFARALLWLGVCLLNTDLDQSQDLAQQALGIFRKTGDLIDAAEALVNLALCEMDPLHKRRLYQEALVIYQSIGDTEGIAFVLFWISEVANQEAEWDRAIQEAEESLAYYQRVHNPDMIATLLKFMAGLWIYKGDMPRAVHSTSEALQVWSELSDESQAIGCWVLRSRLDISEGCFHQATDAIEQAWQISQKTGNLGYIATILSVRCRLARLQGKADQARQFAMEGLKISQELQSISEDILLELGHLELENSELPGAVSYIRQGYQLLIRKRASFGWDSYLDGLAMLAARQSKVELAVLLFNTRWCKGYFYFLSPSERAVRTTIQAEIRNQLGEERYTQLSQEGWMLTYMQMLGMVKEFLEISI